MLEEMKPEEIFAEGGSAKVIAIAEKEAAEFVADATTVKGREAIKSKAYAIGSTMKAKFDKLGKEYGEELKKKAKVIDGERAKIRDRLEEIGAEIRKPVNEFEAREEARIKLIKDQLAALESYGVLADEDTADNIQGKINAIEGFNFTDWQEFEAQAEDIKFSILDRLGKRMIAAAKAEEERKELEKLRAEAAERVRKEAEAEIERQRIANEEKLKKDAADAAILAEQLRAEKEAKRLEEEAAKAIKDKEEADARALKAEQDKLAAAQKAEEDRIAALKKAEEEKTEAVEAERQRIAEVKADEEKAAAARELDIEHKKSVNNNALKAIAEHAKISEDDAKNVVIAIAMGMVPSVKIFY